jgi:muramoyltetrapeptide carboxypeptidase
MTGEVLLPPRLRPGDRVRLVSPASYPDRALVDQCLKVLESWDLRGEAAGHAFDEWGYMAGSDNDRLEDLNEAFRDPGVRAVVATRGGAGAYRIADRLDFAAIRADPKPLVGFSDITYLHLSLLRHCQLTGIHGCLIGPTAQASVRRLLMSTDPIVLQRVPEAVSADIEMPGRARGQLIGGNLASLATSVGVRFPSMSGAVLFLEDQRVVGLGTIDRQLTQLIRSGTLDGIAGVALGSFEGFRGYNDRGWGLADVLADRLGSLGVPVLGGLYAGHDLIGPDGAPDQMALPLGSVATLDTHSGTLTVGPVVR